MDQPPVATRRVHLYLTCVDFPATRNQIVEAAIEVAAPAPVVRALVALPDAEYRDAAEVVARIEARDGAATSGLGGAA